MAAYQTGTVRVTAGSSKVYGTGTEWLTYIALNDLFQRTTENAFYDVAAINTATELTLTSRYSNTGLQSAVASNFASVNTATVNYSGNCGSFTPVIQNNFVLIASPNGGGERFTDNGAGVLTGEGSPAGSGTIDYDSGAWAITFGTALTATVNLSASFSRGNTVDGAGYQIVADFTPNYKIPEMSTNDINFSHIYTKAMRIVDQKIKAATNLLAASVVEASHFKGTVSATFNNAGIVNASITNASVQNLSLLNPVTTWKATNATFTNATIANASIMNASIAVLRAGIARLPQALITNATITNASITNASIQKLRATNASIANASANVLKVRTNLSAVNASITNATIGKLLVNASRFKVDESYDGYSLNATMSATVAFGETLYLDSSWNYTKANAATSGTLPVTAMAVSAGTNRQNFILKGQVCNTAWNWSATALIYAAATDGALTQKLAVGVGNFIQIVGHPLSPDTMMFEPNKALIKVA